MEKGHPSGKPGRSGAEKRKKDLTLVPQSNNYRFRLYGNAFLRERGEEREYTVKKETNP
jgi:hypothetical protein